MWQAGALALSYSKPLLSYATFSRSNGPHYTMVHGTPIHYLHVHWSLSGIHMTSPHCTENSKHKFPEMKLRGLVSNFYIHVLMSGRDYISHARSYLESRISIFLYCVRELSAPAVEPRVHINDPTCKFPIQLRIINKKQLILVVNFLFCLRVNEIPNKTLILDSHGFFFCNAHTCYKGGDRAASVLPGGQEEDEGARGNRDELLLGRSQGRRAARGGGQLGGGAAPSKIILRHCN